MRGKERHLYQVVLYSLALCIAVCSAGRFGFRARVGQCPTAPTQIVAIMTKSADGSMVRELRCPLPGEKNFVVCHCQERRSAAQMAWVVPVFMPVISTDVPTLLIPIVRIAQTAPEGDYALCDPHGRAHIRPPATLRRNMPS